jgi:hypothetical protein
MTAGAFETRSSLLNSATGKFLEEHATVIFEPVYFNEKRVIAGHAAEIVLDGRRLLTNNKALSALGRPCEEIAAVMDLFTYVRAMKFLEEKADKAPSLVMTPVQLTTILRGRYRSAFLEDSASELARQLLVFRVGHFSNPCSRLKINDAAGYLRQRARALIADVAFGDGDLSLFKAAGFHGVGFDVRDQMGLKAVLHRRYPEFIARATKASLRSFVLGAENKDDVVRALNSDFSYVGGAWFRD